ncbi:MAG: AMP-binding protein [Myxococcota bacterium]|nr:AMP-binding protein [Myxococcota bacterium]
MPDEIPPDILTLHAAANPEKPALVVDRAGGSVQQWNYAELDRDTNRLANALLSLGVKARDKVIWCGMNSAPVVRMTHAARKIGATAVPLNYRLSPEEAAYVTDNSDSVLVFADAEFAGTFEKIRAEIPKVRQVLIFGGEARPGMLAAEELEAAASDEAPTRESAGESATMIYTSGTTGKPKGAVRRGMGDPDQLRAMLELIGYQPDDVYLTTGPLYHSGPGGFMGIAYALGNTVVVQRKFDPEDWLRLTQKYRVTSTFSAPTPIRMVCNLPDEVKRRYDTSSMRIMIANAAPWSFALKQAYLADFPPESLWEVYGSTEGGVNTILSPQDQLRKPGSCGLPSPGCEIALFSEDGERIAEPNTAGELYVRSKTVFSTYYRAEEKYQEGLRGDYFSVGDVAYFDEEGYYYICDRKGDMIISGGMNIYPAEIEAALELHDDIADVAVFGIPNEQWGESVHALVVVHPGRTLGRDEIMDFARSRLAGYKIPRSVDFTEEIPRTGSGKILKRVLREPYWRGHESKVL